MARLGKFTEAITYVDSTTGALMPAEGSTVEVYDVDTTNAKTIYSDAGGTSTIPSATITLGADGMCEFYVDSDDRRFDLYISPSGTEFTAFTLEDMAATFDDRAFYSSEYATLQTAISAMSAGDRLIIDANVTVSSTITINSKDDIIIEGQSRGITLTADNVDVISIQDSDRVTIKNISIDGNSSAQVAGPYTGITFESGSGSTMCILEDIYITDMQGDALRYDNTSYLECRNVQCISNQGYGFTHGGTYSARAVRPNFRGCVARSNGQDAGLAHLDGFHASPYPEVAEFSGCRAISNQGYGMFFENSGSNETIDGLLVGNCDCSNNVYSGISINAAAATTAVVLNNLSINGGKFNDNGSYGINYFDDTNNAASYLQAWSISGVTCVDNTQDGVKLDGQVRYGSMVGGSLYSNGASGIELVGDGVGGNSAAYNSLIGLNTCANGSYGVELGLTTEYNTVMGCTSTGNTTEQYYDAGTGNVIFTGAQTSSNFISAPYDSTGTGSGYWFQSTLLFVTGAADGTASASAACSLATTKTKLLALTPLDASAGAAMTSGLGWYSGGVEAGSHVIIRMRDVGAENYRGIFSLMLMDTLEI